jgi:hypothetical protein
MQDPEYLANREYAKTIRFNGHIFTLRSIFDDDIKSAGLEYNPYDDTINDEQPVTFNDVIATNNEPVDLSFNDVIEDNNEIDLFEPEYYETNDGLIIECVN